VRVRSPLPFPHTLIPLVITHFVKVLGVDYGEVFSGGAGLAAEVLQAIRARPTGSGLRCDT